MVVQKAYDGVLMDCQMPVMDGFEATQRIRQLPGLAQLPILAMTANAMAGDRQRCLDAGMNEHIAKPLDVNQLFITLNRWIKGHGVQFAPAPQAAVSLPVIDGLELDSALQRLAGDSVLLRRLLGRFCETERDCIARVRQALAAQAQGDAVRMVHSLKGLAGNIGARELAQRAVDLESLLRHPREGAGLESMLLQVEQDLARLVESIEAALQLAEPVAPAAPETTDMDAATLFAGLDRLHSLLDEDDGESMHVLEPLLPALRARGHGRAADALAELIRRYAYEEALQGLTSLRQALSIEKGR
jgi:CheY-like chemotaxis protein